MRHQGWKQREPRKFIRFQGPDGRLTGKIEVSEIGARGNKHFNRRRPDGPLCECGAPWKPICSTFTCPGSKVPRAMIRSEKQDVDTKRYGDRAPTPAPRPHRRESPTRPIREVSVPDVSVLDGKLKALEAKYGGRHGRRAA